MGEKHGKWNRHLDEMIIEHGWAGKGQAYEGSYNLGVREGHWIHSGLFGHLQSEGNYSNGEPNGHWIFYYCDWEVTGRDNPVKQSEGILKGKEKIGIWKRYKRNGKYLNKLNFDKHPHLQEIYD